ncbi:MAG: YtxH domain-containing protein [Chloroflexi bacterium]|nr:YtxH domain-containing protein [Chloroflexota bacterium]
MKIRDPWLVVGFIAGGLIGLAISWLFAPASGKTTMSKISEDMARARSEARSAGKRAEADILGRYEDLRRFTATIDEGAGSSPMAMPMTVGNGSVRGLQVTR